MGQRGQRLYRIRGGGFDDLFGIRSLSTLSQPVDDYTIWVYFEFRLHESTREIHPLLLTKQKPFALSAGKHRVEIGLDHAG